MTAATATLTDFLLARIAEDEALLKDGGRVYGGEGEVWTLALPYADHLDYREEWRTG